jgi:ribokinase
VFGSAADELPLLCAGPTAAVAAQLAGGARVVVARLAREGALLAGPDGIVTAPALPVTVVSAVGAGDAFNAGYIAAAVAGEPPAEALRWGNAVAALTISRPDRNTPTRAEVDTLLGDSPPT